MTDEITAITETLRTATGGWSFAARAEQVEIGSGARRQTIRLAQEGAEFVFTTVVLASREVTKKRKRWDELARLSWERNAEQEIVTFGFDKHDRLIGQIRHHAATLDEEELDLYLHVLARECDRFEFLLSGADRN